MAETVLVLRPMEHSTERLVDQWGWPKVHWALMAWEKARRIVSPVVDSNRRVLREEQNHLWPGAHNLSDQLVEWLDLWYLSAAEGQ
jgi:hypothetical protein